MKITKAPVPAKSNAGRPKKYDFTLLGGDTCLDIPLDTKSKRENIRRTVYAAATNQGCNAITKIVSEDGKKFLRVWKA